MYSSTTVNNYTQQQLTEYSIKILHTFLVDPSSGLRSLSFNKLSVEVDRKDLLSSNPIDFAVILLIQDTIDNIIIIVFFINTKKILIEMKINKILRNL